MTVYLNSPKPQSAFERLGCGNHCPFQIDGHQQVDVIWKQQQQEVQLLQCEYHAPTQRLSGAIAKPHSNDNEAELHRVVVRASLDGGATFTDYATHALFTGGIGGHRDHFGFSIRLTRHRPRSSHTPASSLARSMASLDDLGRAKRASCIQFAIVVVTHGGGEMVYHDRGGHLFTVALP